MKKQQEHFAYLQAAREDPLIAFQLLSSLGLISEAEKLLVEGFESVQKIVTKAVAQEQSKSLNKREEQKCRIFVQKSRLLFGICDPRNTLKPETHASIQVICASSKQLIGQSFVISQTALSFPLKGDARQPTPCQEET